MRWRVLRGDCVERMARIESGTVDLVLTDPPYGVTAIKGRGEFGIQNNAAVDWERWWPEVRRVRRLRAPVLIMAVQPFTTEVIMSNRGEFRYDWVWEKSSASGALNARQKPMTAHGSILVFAEKGLPAYRPQGLTELVEAKEHLGRAGANYHGGDIRSVQTHTGYPRSVVRFGSTMRSGRHPTEKPVDLCEYFIRTYSDEGGVVLDPFMGSGSTGVAALRAGRRFVGIEVMREWYDKAKERLRDAAQ